MTLSGKLSGKGSNRDSFQNIEFNLYEPRRNKTVKGKLLGTAVVDLSDYAATKYFMGVLVLPLTANGLTGTQHSLFSS